MRVDNDVANELLVAVREGKRTQEFLDKVSGVEGYEFKNHKRQGHVRNLFSRELISEQFLIDFDDIISVFWTGVFEHLDKAKLHGEVVDIKAPGQVVTRRETDKNPIHYLRSHGQMAVRNHITSLYRKNLQQGCAECGHRAPISTDKTCPKCKSAMSTMYKFADVDEPGAVFQEVKPPQHKQVEERDTAVKLNGLLDQFANEVLGGPSADKPEGTRAYQILKILTDPDASKSMCASCKLCDSDIFDIEQCTNYSANIGRWLGVNKTMIAHKVRRIRKALVQFLLDSDSSEARSLAAKIPSKYKSLRIINQ